MGDCWAFAGEIFPEQVERSQERLGGAPPDEGAVAQGALAQGGSEVQRGDWTLPVKVGGNPMWIGAIGTLLILEQGREEPFSAEA